MKRMHKERLTAFFDAVIAIIMTILVLEIAPPSSSNFSALWQMRIFFYSYFISFFWLGTMWIHMHNVWYPIEYIDQGCLWWSLILLFFSSLIPFASSYINDFPDDSIAACFYVLLSLLVTIANYALLLAMKKANPENEAFQAVFNKRKRKLKIDMLIKISGLLISIVYPQFALLAVLVALIYIIV